MITKINEYLSYFPSVEEPVLSSDVFVIYGKDNLYLFDIGNNPIIIDEINILKPEAVFISHFHLDHVGQLSQSNIKNCYASNYTTGKIKCGTPIQSMSFTDGVSIKAEMIPSSHAKGCLCLTLNQEITLVGDALYPDHDSYNVSKLYDLIHFLETLDTKYLISSHRVTLMEKGKVIQSLKNIYNRKEKGNPFIKVNGPDSAF